MSQADNPPVAARNHAGRFAVALALVAPSALAAASFGGCESRDRADPDAIAPAVPGHNPFPEAVVVDAGADGDAAGDAAVSADGAPSRALRLMTYDVRHGERAGLEAIADTITAAAPDLVGLQDVDVDAARSGAVDQPQRLGQLTGMTSLFRTAVALGDGGSYGVALLSRFPLVASDRVVLPSSGEARVLALVDVAITKGEIVKVAVTHFDAVAASRTQQAAEVRRVLSGVPRAILLGDLAATPDEAAIVDIAGFMQDAWIGAGKGDGFTTPADAPTKRVDYVFLGSGIGKAVSAEVVATGLASDHRPVVATIPFP